MTNRTINFICAMAAVALLPVVSVQALVVNVDVEGSGHATYSGQGAYVDPGNDYWNSAPAGDATHMLESDGTTATGVSVATGSGSTHSWSAAHNMLGDYSSTKNGASSISITGLDANTDYKVYAYLGGDNTGQATTLALGGVTVVQTSAYQGSDYVEGATGNYFVMNVTTDGGGALTGTFTHTFDQGSKDYSALRGLQIVEDVPDADPPTPNPAAFAVPPIAYANTAISMTATTGIDASGPVEYLFTETSGNPGGTSSEWQTSTTYADVGLTSDTEYTYTVQMRDSVGNTGTASAPASAITTVDGIVVTSIADFLTYVNQSSVTVTLAPGTYSIDAADVTAGTISNPIFLFEGSDSTYDFTGATINFDTDILRAFGNVDVYEIQILGNNNVLKNLTMVDDGLRTDAPAHRATNIVMDGSGNRLEGFHMTIKGSYPYGYGDAFGKGGGSAISHNKHSALLVRGDSNHVKDCTLIHRAYGHAIFMQAAVNPLIEGCYIEGEVRTTDDMLAETSGPAFDIDFLTVWEDENGDRYRLPAGYMMSLQEAGVRAYNAGETFIDGVAYSRGTSNPTIRNCTIKRVRAGITLTHASGTETVEGCTTLECERGFAIGNGSIVDCRSDAVYGPAAAFDGTSSSSMTADITILPSHNEYNGSTQVCSLTGNGYDITLRSNESNPNQSLSIDVSGIYKDIRNYGVTNLTATSGVQIHNVTGYPLILGPESSTTTGESCGPITDDGVNNNVSTMTCNTSSGPYAGTPHVIPGQIEAEEYDFGGEGVAYHDTTAGNAGAQFRADDVDISMQDAAFVVVDTIAGEWLEYTVDATAGTVEMNLRVATPYDDKQMVVTLGGVILGTVDIPNTGSWSSSQTVTVEEVSIPGGSGGQILRIEFVDGDVDCNWIEFFRYTDAFATIEAEDHDAQFGTVTENGTSDVGGGQHLGYIANDDWAAYTEVDFGNGAGEFQARISSKTAGGNIEIRLGSITGTLLGTCPVATTGNWNTWATRTTAVTSVSGVHDVYLVFTGGSGSLFNLNWFTFADPTPSAAPAVFLPGVSVSNEIFTAQFTGTVGAHYRLETTEDLIAATNGWLMVTDIISLPTSPFEVSAPSTNDVGFYRVIGNP